MENISSEFFETEDFPTIKELKRQGQRIKDIRETKKYINEDIKNIEYIILTAKELIAKKQAGKKEVKELLNETIKKVSDQLIDLENFIKKIPEHQEIEYQYTKLAGLITELVILKDEPLKNVVDEMAFKDKTKNNKLINVLIKITIVLSAGAYSIPIFTAVILNIVDLLKKKI